MESKKRWTIFLISFAFVIFGALSCATVGKRTVPLMATKMHPGARGTATISDSTISLQANGLKPNSVYTAWFVNMKPAEQKAGAGNPPYMFRTDSSGAGAYKAPLKSAPFGKWQMLMIVLHPSGNPTVMSGMVPALSAKIPKTR
ncbi:MAG: hypothetical protein ACE5NJ_12475 [Thermodesulfobacteriota bacterium]